MLSTGAKTWVRCERGKVVQTKSADTLIRLLGQDFTFAHRLMLRAGIENFDADVVFAGLYQREHARVVQVLETLKGFNADDVADAAEHIMHILRYVDHERE